MDELNEIRDHYDTTDTSAEMDEGVWETDVDADPMVTTSLRLPKSLLDWVRAQAATEQVRPTALIRRWIKQHRGREGEAGNVTARVARLERAVFDRDSA